MAGQLPTHHAHDASTAAVSARLQQFSATKTPFRVFHGSTNSTRKSPYSAENIVDISHMNRILSLDASRQIVFAEPNVPMDALVARTLQHGLLPPVVMEFPGITVGGGFSGTSGESSSFRYGFFDRTVKMVEIVLGDGEIVLASDEIRPDLFRGAASAFGTLGVITMLTIKLIPAKSYVSLTYVPICRMDEALEIIKSKEQCAELDYMDGLFFARDRGLLCLGKLVDSSASEAEITRFSRPWDDWFYINAERKSRQRGQWTELIPVEDYLFRYDRGAFWMGKYTYRYFGIPCTRFTRWLLDRYTHTRVMYQALHQSGLSSSYIIQDIAIPFEKSEKFLSYLDEQFRNYPIWICPVKTSSASEEFDMNESMAPQSQRMLSFGVWGPGPARHADFVAWNVALEQITRSLQGWKWLYAHAYYTESEFWNIYNLEQRELLRTKYHARHLPTLYEKVKVSRTRELPGALDSPMGFVLWLYAFFWSIWPLSGLYGWMQCVIAEDYLLSQPKKLYTH